MVKVCDRGTCGQQRPRSDCTDAQSDLGLLYPLTESLDAVAHIEVLQMPGSDCAASLSDLDL